MKRSILFVIDPISTLNHTKDSSLLMMHHLQSKGYDIYICTLNQLGFTTKNGAYAYAEHIILKDDYQKNPEFIQNHIPAGFMILNDFNMIFMRKDPPVNSAYLDALKILNLVDRSKTHLINPPELLQILNEKLFAFEFPNLIPDACFTSNQDQALDFAKNYDKIILKPIDGMGGKGIFISDAQDPNFSVIFETLSNNAQQSVLLQAFIPEITEGDKRILIIDGQVFDHALVRIPKSGQIRGNLAAGGHYKAMALSMQDYDIAKEVAQRLIKENIRICGIDVIGDKLTEINITSPTCFQQLNQLTGRNPFDLFLC